MKTFRQLRETLSYQLAEGRPRPNKHWLNRLFPQAKHNPKGFKDATKVQEDTMPLPGERPHLKRGTGSLYLGPIKHKKPAGPTPNYVNGKDVNKVKKTPKVEETVSYEFGDALSAAQRRPGHKLTYGTASKAWHVVGPNDRDYHTSFALEPHVARKHGETKARELSTGSRFVHEAAKVKVSVTRPIGTRIADIGPGGKEVNVKTDAAWRKFQKQSKPSNRFGLGLGNGRGVA